MPCNCNFSIYNPKFLVVLKYGFRNNLCLVFYCIDLQIHAVNTEKMPKQTKYFAILSQFSDGVLYVYGLHNNSGSIFFVKLVCEKGRLFKEVEALKRCCSLQKCLRGISWFEPVSVLFVLVTLKERACVSVTDKKLLFLRYFLLHSCSLCVKLYAIYALLRVLEQLI